jgi:hypothetical protein
MNTLNTIAIYQDDHALIDKIFEPYQSGSSNGSLHEVHLSCWLGLGLVPPITADLRREVSRNSVFL